MSVLAGKAKARLKTKLYYGWLIVLVVGLCGVAETADFNPVIGAFIKPITSDFGWSRSTFVGATSLGTLLGGLAAVFVGPFVDKHGARWVLFAGFLLAGGALIARGTINNLAQFYAVTILSRLAVGSFIGLSLSVLIPNWFIKKRGRAVALSNLGVRFGVAVQPLIAISLISAYGWRTSTVCLGLLTWGLTLLPVALIIRRRPEDLGLLPDGEVSAPDKNSKSNGGAFAAAPPKKAEQSFTAKQAMRSRTFYLLIISFSFVFFVSTGTNLHLIAFLGDRGLSAGASSAVVTVWSSIGVIGTLTSGFLSERVHIRYIAIFVYIFLALGIFILSQVHSLPMALAFAFAHGIVWGANQNI